MASPAAKPDAGARRLIPWVAPLVFLAALPLANPLANPPIWDEFIWLCEGSRLSDGQFPHADYFTFLPAGNALLAALFRVLAGRSVLLPRLFLWAAMGLWSMGMLRLAVRRSVPGPAALAVGLATPFVFVRFWPIASHHWWATALVPWALLEMDHWLGDGESRRLRRAALLVGGIGLFLQSPYVLMAGALGVAVLAKSRRIPAAFLWVLWPLAVEAGLALTAGGVAGLHSAFHDLWVLPLAGYAQSGGPNDAGLLHELHGMIQWIHRKEWNIALLRGATMGVLWGAPLLAIGLGVRHGFRAASARTLPVPMACSALLIVAGNLAVFLLAPSAIHLAEAGPLFAAALLLLVPADAGRRAAWPFLAAVLVGLLQPLQLWHLGAAGKLASADRVLREGDPVWNAIQRSPYAGLEDPILVLPQGAAHQFWGFRNPTRFNLMYEERVRYYSPAQKDDFFRGLEAAPPRVVILFPADRAPGFEQPGSRFRAFLDAHYRRAGTTSWGHIYERADPP